MNEEKATSLDLSRKGLTAEHALPLAAKLQVWMRLFVLLASCVPSRGLFFFALPLFHVHVDPR